MLAIDLAPLLYTSFVETEDPQLVGAPEWCDLVVETRARWLRMAAMLQNRMQSVVLAQTCGGAVGCWK